MSGYGHPTDGDGAFATKFRSLEEIIEAELDAELAAKGLGSGTASGPIEVMTSLTANSTRWKLPLTAAPQLNRELDEMEAKRMAASVPATIDVAPLEQRFEPQRRDFDAKLSDLRQIDVRSIQANLIGNQYAELAATLDAEAKGFIEAAEAEFAPAIEKQRAALQATRDILNRIIEGPKQVRDLCKPISATYQLRVNEKAEQKRRELERQQREAAEAERQAEVRRLKEQAAAEQDEAEKGRIEEEAKEVAAAPAIPASVPISAVSAPKPAGVSGTLVFVHRIVNWGMFCAALALMKPTITSDGNNTRVVLAGITIDFSFTGLKKTKEAVKGMAVSSQMEVRNRR